MYGEGMGRVEDVRSEELALNAKRRIEAGMSQETLDSAMYSAVSQTEARSKRRPWRDPKVMRDSLFFLRRRICIDRVREI